jgi:predicted transcriptional regulator of viral defense system
MRKQKRESLSDPYKRAVAIFRQQGGLLRTMSAIRLGISPRVLYGMRDEGIVEPLERGLHRLASLPPLGNPDLITVAVKAPGAVLCLVSALAFHEMTTQIPHEVYVALPRGAESPRIQYPPLRIFWFKGEAYSEGIEIHQLDKVTVRVYSPEKTLADCFKYRNKIGLDTVLEGLRFFSQRRRRDLSTLVKFARICRVENVMRPYLEAAL